MKWYKILYQFWSSNLERNAKRISIGFGSFLIVVITTCSLPTHIFLASLYGAGISFGSMVIMSIFGKNGNGVPIVEKEPENELPIESIKEAMKKVPNPYVDTPIIERAKKSITLP